MPKKMSPKKQSIRCFRGNALPHQPFWRFVGQDQSESGQVEMELYGVISEYSWFEDEITPAQFKNDLYANGNGGPVLIKINSPGGDVIAASVMRDIIRDYPGAVTARVTGLAASAAVVVTLAAEEVEMVDTAYLMIHDPAVAVLMAILDIETLGKLRDELKAIKDGMLPVYASRTGLSEEKISKMMADETWMSARQAVNYGFADAIIEGGQRVEPTDQVAYVNCLEHYERVPKALRRDEPIQPRASSEPAWTDDQEREAQTLRERVAQILKKETNHA